MRHNYETKTKKRIRIKLYTLSLGRIRKIKGNLNLKISQA